MIDMSKIAPPVELCKRIPEGCFEDSALIYVVWSCGAETRINCIPRVMRDEYAEMMIRTMTSIDEEYPVPTLQEILANLGEEICIAKVSAGILHKCGFDTADAAMNVWLIANGNKKYKEEK